MKITSSNQTIDLGGETYKGDILVQGPVSGVVIRNGRVNGEIRCRASDYKALVEKWNKTGDWTKAVREAAPRGVTISNLVVNGMGASHQVYAGPGCSNIKVRKVRFTGQSLGPSVYLSMESEKNLVSGCSFEAVTGERREVMSIDGSARNLIENNRFLRCRWGGIYIYRNSGEHGQIRHQEPRFNVIQGNRFDLTGMWVARVGYGSKGVEVPHGVIIGSRQGSKYHSPDDAGYPWGSSADDRDFARENVVTGNLFRGDWLNRWVLDADKQNTVSGNKAW